MRTGDEAPPPRDVPSLPVPPRPLDGQVLRPSDNDGSPTPNYDTVPPRPGGDPLVEPVRPKRVRVQTERYTPASIAAHHVELATRLGAVHVFDDNTALARRPAECNTDAALAGVAGLDHFDYLNSSLASLDPLAQRAACLMADYDDSPTSTLRLLIRPSLHGSSTQRRCVMQPSMA